jgi:retinol dehydrogenase-12
LYGANATVYIAGRSQEKGDKALAALKEAYPASKGQLHFIILDLSDLKTVKPAVDAFLAKETRLDVLTNNAGVMRPPKGSVDAQGYELQLGTNVLGPFLFTKLLTPTLLNTAKTAPPNSVRVTWAASLATSVGSPTGGVEFGPDGAPKVHPDPATDYSQSKAANTYLAAEFAARYGKDGVISLGWNPGNLTSELQRHMDAVSNWILHRVLLYPTVFGGYTELFCAVSPDVDQSHNGAYVAPWGRFLHPRSDVIAGMKRSSEGGTGIAEKLWEFCDKETSKYT